MSNPNDEWAACVLGNHGPHAKPWLFALHETRRLWYFDLCLPHGSRGDAWRAPRIRTEDIARGKIFPQLQGEDFIIKTTGHRPFELRAEFCARLAWELANATPAANITAKYYRSRLLETDGERLEKPDPNWPPWIPEALPTKHEAQAVLGADEWRSVASYEVGEDAVTLYLKTIGDIRDVVRAYEYSLSNLPILPFIDRPTAHVGFELEDERWYLNYDSDALPSLVKSLCDLFGVELVSNDETLADHRPYLEEYLRRLAGS